jgi:phosphomannomutase
MKSLCIFDLDGTLAESKSPIDAEMAALLARLLEVVRVAIISGAAWAQFEKQVLSNIPRNACLDRLSVLPTCGTKFYRHDGGWKELYSEDLTAEEKGKIVGALSAASDLSGFGAERRWGESIEDRGTQITWSALGQEAPLEEKTKWDRDFAKRKKMSGLLVERLPEFSVHLGGATSIDVTKPGVDKGYGIRKLRDQLGVAIPDMLFVGDAIFPGGNDYPAKEAGVACIKVRDPEESQRVIETIIACLESEERPARDSGGR